MDLYLCSSHHFHLKTFSVEVINTMFRFTNTYVNIVSINYLNTKMASNKFCELKIYKSHRALQVLYKFYLHPN